MHRPLSNRTRIHAPLGGALVLALAFVTNAGCAAEVDRHDPDTLSSMADYTSPASFGTHPVDPTRGAATLSLTADGTIIEVGDAKFESRAVRDEAGTIVAVELTTPSGASTMFPVMARNDFNGELGASGESVETVIDAREISPAVVADLERYEGTLVAAAEAGIMAAPVQVAGLVDDAGTCVAQAAELGHRLIAGTSDQYGVWVGIGIGVVVTGAVVLVGWKVVLAGVVVTALGGAALCTNAAA